MNSCNKYFQICVVDGKKILIDKELKKLYFESCPPQNKTQWSGISALICLFSILSYVIGRKLKQQYVNEDLWCFSAIAIGCIFGAVFYCFIEVIAKKEIMKYEELDLNKINKEKLLEACRKQLKAVNMAYVTLMIICLITLFFIRATAGNILYYFIGTAFFASVAMVLPFWKPIMRIKVLDVLKKYE